MVLGDIFNIAIYKPIYNALIAITAFVPTWDVGIALIILTVFVKILILPLSHHSVKASATLKKLDPEIKQIRSSHKDNQKEQAEKIMALYKKHGINPFSGCLFTFLQFPIIIGLYFVFWKGLSGGNINIDMLYPFLGSYVNIPESLNFIFLGLVDISEKSFILAVLAGLSQWYLMKFSAPKFNKEAQGSDESFSDEFKRGLAFQMRYILPFFVGFISLSFQGAVPLYWTTNNVFSITHELFVKRKAGKLVSNPETPKT